MMQNKILKYIAIVIFIVVLNSKAAINNYVAIKNENTISNAIAALNAGDTLFLEDGIYNEWDIEIDKNITIIGKENTIIDGKSQSNIFIINSDSVSIIGVTIRNTGMSFVTERAAIMVNKVADLKLQNNKIENCYFGIYIKHSNNITISDNVISGRAVNQATSGNAIHLWYSKNITISNNKTTKHRDGIYLEFSDNCTIEDNISMNNLRYGLHFMFSNNCNYKRNTFSKNGAGVAVMFSKKINMVENIFSENWGSASYGLLLKEITDGKIERNTFYSNTVGIFADGMNRMETRYNTFEQNGWAIKMMSNSYDNTISYNNFLVNTFEFSTNGNYFNSTLINNYWSTYKGYDLTQDGIGDVPHRPMKLFAYLVENTSESIILLRSLLVEMLNIAESVIPSLTPRYLTDDEPLMKKVNIESGTSGLGSEIGKNKSETKDIY